MPLECPHCGRAMDVVHFRRPGRRPWQVKLLLGVFVLAALLTVWHAFLNLVDVGQLLPIAEQLRLVVAQLQDEGRLDGQTLALLRDASRAFSNTLVVVSLGLLGFVVVALARYSWVVGRAVRSGHPGALHAIRFIAWVEIAFEVGILALKAAVLGDLETVPVEYGFGAPIVLAPAMLVMTRWKAVRTYFSDFALRRAPPAAAPPPSW